MTVYFLRALGRLAAASLLPLGLVACSGNGTTLGTGAASGSDCRFLSAGDFAAIGKTLRGTPIYNHQAEVHVRDCYYDLGSENDLAYLDLFDRPSDGQQYYTDGTDPAAGNGTPVQIPGLGDSAYWLASGDTIFVRKGAVIVQLKLVESGKSPNQVQADAIVLAGRVLARI